MDFISPVIEFFSSHLLEPLTRHANYLLKARANIDNMEKDSETMRALHGDLQKMKEDAVKKREQITGELDLWEKNVSRIQERVEATKNNYQNRGCVFFGDCSFNCCFVYKHGKEAVELQDAMAKLIRDWKDFRTTTVEQSPQDMILTKPIESTLLGLDPYVKRVQDLLSNDSVGVIGVHGMGGIGKTTLMKKIHNLLLDRGNKMGFVYLIWVVVSKEFQLEKLQGQVARSLGLKLDNIDDPASFISSYLKDKSFLLFLDDVWEWLNLLEIGIPDTHCSSSNNTKTNIKQKVILTTRFENVCARMRVANAMIRVELLKVDDARTLFKKTLDSNCLDNPQIHQLAEEVADECGGLPLALTSIARAMASKTRISEWKQALRYLRKSQVSEIVDDNLIMLHRLKLSYDSLKNDALRDCFLYCALWPEDHDILDVELIDFLIGNKVIKDFDSTDEAYDIGQGHIEDLKGACLLENGRDDNNAKMHDVMRDMALWIALECGKKQNKWFVKPGIGLKEAPCDDTKWEQAEIVSLMHNDFSELPSIPCECPTSILLLNDNPLAMIHPNFFFNMHALTYLDLSNTRISKLPESITALKRLRSLNLEGTRLLESIPSRMISGFQELQVLNLFQSGACKILDCLPEDGEEEKERGEVVANVASEKKKKDSLVEELERLPRGLVGLGVNLYTAKSFGGLSMLSRVSVWHLRMWDIQGLLVVLQLRPHMWRALLRLELYYCHDVEVVEFGCDARIESKDTCPLLHLEISDMERLKEIQWMPRVAPSVFFSRLRSLDIRQCHQMKSISWVLCLPSLIRLSLVDCDGLECLLLEEEEKEDGQGRRTATTPSPCLKEFDLGRLPNLSCISSSSSSGHPVRSLHLPALETLTVWDCPKLKKFPLLLPRRPNKPRELICDKEWLEGVEWDEPVMASFESILFL